ncbi:MAG: insulinase family protein [candidate division NC10 bacterium]|nr:insulinase family protein [candidate division NC10 bacterium]
MTKRVLLLLLVVLVLPGMAGAQLKDRIFEKTLSNGLKVLLLEEPKAPVVTVQIWYKVGSRNEVAGRTGLSHLLEHMMFKGTERYGPKQFSRIVQRNGGQDNAFTSSDYTAYFENFAAEKVELGLELEADRMQNLLLDPKEALSERDVVREERRLRTEDDPVSALGEEVEAVAFKAHPYAQPVVGWDSDLEGLTREDLLEYYKTYYVPNNAVLVVVGDFKKEEVLPKIEASFGGIPPGSEPPAVRAKEPPQQGERRLFLKKEAELPFLYITYHVPNLTHPDSYALDVLEMILSAGRSSRIYRSLVYEKQIALFAGGEYLRVSKDPNLFYFYASVMPGKSIEEVEKALYEEIERLKREPVSDRELEKAKNQVEASFLMGQDSIFALAMALGRHEVMGDWRFWEKYLPGIRKVAKEDLMRVAKTYLVEDNRTVGILIPIEREGT